MKKLIFLYATIMVAMGSFAQTAVSTAKFLDNTYVTVGGGVSTPLNLTEIFPLNPSATVAVGKQFSPVWGAEVEGTAWFGSHITGQNRFGENINGNYNAVRGSYLGLNGTVNATNLFKG
ncbi:MAG: OmpA family protein, partial [Paludibacteraceae bacterium]|nr:OmpA family protein [Paludibacteraceae bacterium]